MLERRAGSGRAGIARAAIIWIVIPWTGTAGCAPPPPAAEAGGPAAAAPLCDRIRTAIIRARDGRRLDAGVHGAWQVVHGILAFGPEFPLAHDGRVVRALDHLLGGGPLTGWRLRPGGHGVVAIVDEGSTTGQGHPDQWLGYLSQCGRGGLSLDAKLVVAGHDYTLADLLEQAKFDIRPGQEATWTLMALAAYVPPDTSWTAADGSSWTVEDVVRMEADADLSTSACGGAHRIALRGATPMRPSPVAGRPPPIGLPTRSTGPAASNRRTAAFPRSSSHAPACRPTSSRGSAPPATCSRCWLWRSMTTNSPPRGSPAPPSGS
ncbi:MAG: hypothetical protein EBZ74_03385 [Planctomycetia bacterium]|nr:hypothetical protein [Planctomycetia bacterium]